MRYETPFVWDRGQISLDPQMIAEYRERGVPERLFREWIDTVCPVGSVKRHVLIARAYDNAHNTSTHLKLPSISDLPEFDLVE